MAIATEDLVLEGVLLQFRSALEEAGLVEKSKLRTFGTVRCHISS